MTEKFHIIATVKTKEQAEIALGYENTLLRVNSSHMEIPQLVSFVSELNEKHGKIPVYVDLQGSKISVSRAQPQIKLDKGQKVTLTVTEPTAETNKIHIGNPNTIKLLSKGTHVKIDDGRIELIIEEVIDNETAVASVMKEGVLRPGKGFNLYPHPFIQNELSPRDKEIVEKLKDLNNVRFALSFVSVPEEIIDLKKRSNNKLIAAKLEREMSEDQVKAICDVSDSVWICRGDMGVQMGFVEMAKFVRNFTINYIPKLKIPVIMAGEVMEHFCEHKIPTRTELCYLGNCIAEGYKGIVLSDETVFGKYEKECIEFCSKFIKEYLSKS